MSRLHNWWQRVNHPTKTFNGREYILAGCWGTKTRVKNVVDMLNAKGYKTRVVYDPTWRGRKYSFWDDPIGIKRWEGKEHDSPSWSVYLLGTLQDVERLRIPCLQRKFDKPWREYAIH